MTKAGTLTVLALLAIAPAFACAQGRVTKDAPSRSFEVAVFGDMPYVPNPDTGGLAETIMREYHAVLASVAASPASRVVHIGDMTGYHCADSVLALRRADFDAMPHPLVLVPGDNEWIDCGRTGFDPLERLAYVREHFAAGDSSLGAERIRLTRQSEGVRFREFRENVQWVQGGVLFVTVHVVPLPPDYRDSPPRALELARREAANIAWLRESFAYARRGGMRGVAVFLQANPGWGARLRPEFIPVRDELIALAAAFQRPVAVIHGDSHICRVDRPAVDGAGRPVANLVRAETFGNPRHHWLRMTVTPGSADLFAFAPVFVPGNARATCQVHGRLVAPDTTGPASAR